MMNFGQEVLIEGKGLPAIVQVLWFYRKYEKVSSSDETKS